MTEKVAARCTIRDAVICRWLLSNPYKSNDDILLELRANGFTAILGWPRVRDDQKD